MCLPSFRERMVFTHKQELRVPHPHCWGRSRQDLSSSEFGQHGPVTTARVCAVYDLARLLHRRKPSAGQHVKAANLSFPQVRTRAMNMTGDQDG